MSIKKEKSQIPITTYDVELQEQNIPKFSFLRKQSGKSVRTRSPPTMPVVQPLSSEPPEFSKNIDNGIGSGNLVEGASSGKSIRDGNNNNGVNQREIESESRFTKFQARKADHRSDSPVHVSAKNILVKQSSVSYTIEISGKEQKEVKVEAKVVDHKTTVSDFPSPFLPYSKDNLHSVAYSVQNNDLYGVSNPALPRKSPSPVNLRGPRRSNSPPKLAGADYESNLPSISLNNSSATPVQKHQTLFNSSVNPTPVGFKTPKKKESAEAEIINEEKPDSKLNEMNKISIGRSISDPEPDDVLFNYFRSLILEKILEFCYSIYGQPME